MKTLWILRHGEAATRELDQRDFDRPLTDQGQRDVKTTTAQMCGVLPPVLIVVSPAKRTQATARLAAEQLGLPESVIQTVDAFYQTQPQEILEWLLTQSDSLNTIIVVGHNPTVSDLCSHLAHDSIGLCEAEGRGFTFQTDHWAEIDQVDCKVKRCEP